jgi:hypothetical protein
MSWGWWKVYVILLADDAKREPKVRRENPKADPRKPCVYVGVTITSRENRFERLKGSGRSSNKFVRSYGLRLTPEYYLHEKAVRSEDEAEKLEDRVAEQLRAKGFWVLCGKGFPWPTGQSYLE